MLYHLSHQGSHFHFHIYVRGVCNFLISVLPQQKFEAMDRPVLQPCVNFLGLRKNVKRNMDQYWQLHVNSTVLFDKQREIHPRGVRVAAAKSLQSCSTLCDPIDGSPPGSPVPGILQARTLEWVAISFSNEWKWKVKVKSFSCVWLLATPWTHQAPPSMGFSRQEYWSGVPLPSPEWGWADPKDTKRREAPGSILAPLFICFFLLLLSMPYVNWASQEVVCFTWGPDSSPRTFLCSIFSFVF